MMPVVSNDLFIFFDLFSISLFKIVNMYVIWLVIRWLYIVFITLRMSSRCELNR